MAIAAEVRRIPKTLFGKSPNSIQPKDMKLKFVDSRGIPLNTNGIPDNKTSFATEEEARAKATEIAKGVWHSRFSRAETKDKYRRPPPK